ncbi:hypothetical protein ACEPAF_8645 [Sanghuangporus sanghuang]
MVVDFMLRDAAICGDVDTFRRLVQDGEDANTVLGPLILGAPSFEDLDPRCSQDSAPGRLSILSFLLENHCLTLYTLNASHSSLKGLTPLGMATYLNRLDFVTVLLGKGDGLVLVDGVDSQRATPIMYAARDGHDDLLLYLIRQGAKTNSVDCYYHSVLFYATSTPRCLWACELNLRLQRAQSLLSHGKKRKLKLTMQQDIGYYNAQACLYRHHATHPLSSSAIHSCMKRLVTSISSSDLSAVHHLLFPSRDSQDPSVPVPVPVLVNHPDENGWSAIHYCVTLPRPSVSVLDVLFLAGADLSLYTADSTMTPLHALARFGASGNTGSFRLYAFIVHLVRDLGAPLGAVDLQGETCIHVAARCGSCAEILMAFLECDVDGSIVKMKNNDGQTAYEVAKPEFRYAFEQDEGSVRPGSAASLRTIRPSYSSSSLATNRSSGSSSSSGSFQDDEEEEHEQFPPPVSREKECLRSVLISPEEAQRLLDNLECVAEQLRMSRIRNDNHAHPYSALKGKGKEPADLDDVEELLQLTRQSSSDLLERFRQLIDFELDDLQSAKDVHASLEQLILRLEERALAEQVEECSATPALTYRRSSATPSLVASGSTASLASLADLAALATPTGSPRMGTEDLKTPRFGKTFTAEDGEAEIDFACALAAGSVTRQRRASALSGVFALATTESSISPDFTLPFSDPSSPLEDGVNLVSIPPTRAPEVHESIFHPQEPESSPGVRVGRKAKGESWLDPYVRRANSDILKAHLANLLEIEQMLFGEEDREREDAPSPGSVSSEEDGVGWREGVDVAEVHETDSNVWEGLDGEGDYGNFLEIFDVDEDDAINYHEEGNAPFLDLVISTKCGNEEDDGCCSNRASTVKPTNRGSVFACGPPSALDILKIARRELYAAEETMLTACRSVETAQHYISEAESLTSDIFEKMDHVVQASQLTSALSDIHSGKVAVSPQSRSRNASISSSADTYYGRTPAGSPVIQRTKKYAGYNVNTNAESCALPRPPPVRSSTRTSREQSLARHPSIDSLLSISSSPASSGDSPVKVSADHEPLLLPMEGMRTLRRLLVRKIPLWLDATAYDVDKACTWVGVVQAVVQNVRRARMV